MYVFRETLLPTISGGISFPTPKRLTWLRTQLCSFIPQRFLVQGRAGVGLAQGLPSPRLHHGTPPLLGRLVEPS
jgi:hypothetical protein